MGTFYLIHNYLVENRFLLMFLSHACRSMKILSLAEEASHLERTAKLLFQESRHTYQRATEISAGIFKRSYYRMFIQSLA